MGFFTDDDFIQPERPRPERPKRPEWVAPPTDQLPVRMPDNGVLYRRDSVALLLSGIDVYSNGAEIKLAVIGQRSDTVGDEAWDAVEEAFHLAMRERKPGVGLRVGVMRSDGIRLVALTDGFWVGQTGDARPRLRMNDRGGGGGGDEFLCRLSAWLWPLPSPGTLELHFWWPGLGIPESSVDIDADAIIEAASRALPIWPASG